MSPAVRRRVVRPSVPPAAWLGAGVWAGALLAEELAWRAYAASMPAPVSRAWALILLAVVVAAVVLVKDRRRAAVALVLLGLAAGLSAGTVHWRDWRADVNAAVRAGAQGWRGVVADEPESERGSTRVTIRVDGGARVQVTVPGTSTVLPGMVVDFRGVAAAPDPAGPWGRIEARRGICAEVRAWRFETTGWARGPEGVLMRARGRVVEIVAALPGEGADLLASVLLGDKRRLTGTPLEQDFRTVGLAHLLAASSLYAGLLCAGTALLARRVRLPRAVQALAGVIAACVFAVSAGLRPSLVRGLLMVLAAAAAPLAGRRGDPLGALGVAVTAAMLTWPPAACDLGLALGAAAVAGLCLYGGLARAWLEAAMPEAAARLASPLSAVLTVQVTTLPITASAFGLVSLVGPVASLAATPLAALALGTGATAALAAALGVPGARVLMTAAAGVFSVLAATAHALASRPNVAVAVGPWAGGTIVAFAVVLALAWAVWPLPPRRSYGRAAVIAGLTAVTLLLVVPGSGRGPELVVMDVGQGDAILLRDGGASMLVDTGPTPAALRGALARAAVRRVDCLVLTHDHADHTGGLAGLAGVTTVGWVGVPLVAESRAFTGVRAVCGRLTPPKDDRVRTFLAGQAWRVGETEVRVVWPERAVPGAKPNDTSVVLLLTRRGVRLLLTGDAEEASLHAIAADSVTAPVDALKVAHHGSRNGVDADALAAWRPREALISVGAGNDFGHPAAETLRALREHGAIVHRTDLEGDLVVRLGDRTFDVGERGDPRSRYGTIAGAASPAAVAPAAPVFPAESHGIERSERPQARLPDLRRRGSVARARGPPS